MRRRCLMCLMLMLVSSPQPLTGAITKGRNTVTISTPTASATAADDDEKSKELHDVLSSLEAAFRFMADEAAALNLDAIIGTRMVEGRSQSQHFSD